MPEPGVEKELAHRARPARWIEQARRFLVGDDVFISYARADALDYALNLASALTDAEVSCYLDQWQLSPGQELPPSLQLHLRRSTLLVLIATARAAASLPVEQELDVFLKTGRPILLVDVDGSVRQATWYPRLQGLPVTPEPADAILAAKPSPLVIQRITSALGFHRRNRRLRRVFLWTAVGVGLLVALGSASAAWLWRDAREALAQKELADTAAETQRRIAVSRRIAGYAASQRAEVPDLALLLATAAADTHATFEARREQMNLLLKPPNLTGMLDLDRGGVWALAVSPARDAVAIAAGSSVILVDPATHRRRGCPLAIPSPDTLFGKLRDPDPILALAFSQDGQHLFGRGAWGSYLWEVASGARFSMPEHALTLAPSGELVTLLPAGDPQPGGIAFWDVSHPAAPRHLRDLDLDAPVLAVSFAPSGRWMAFATSKHDVYLWDLHDEKRLEPALRGHAEMIASMTFSPNSALLATADLKGNVRVWDTATRALWATPDEPGDTAAGEAVAFSADGSILAAASRDGSIALFAPEDRYEIDGRWSMRDHGADPIHSHWSSGGSLNPTPVVAFGARPDEVITGHGRGGIAFWRAGEPKGYGRVFPHHGSLLVAALGADGAVFAEPADGEVHFTEVNSGAQGLPLPAPRGFGDVVDLAYSRDGSMLLAAYREDGLIAWDTRTRAPRWQVRAPERASLRSPAISATGQRVFAAVGEGRGLVWDMRHPEQPPQVLGAPVGDAYASFTGTDGTLITAGRDGEIDLWDLEHPARPAHQIAARGRAVVAAYVLPGSDAIAVVYDDGWLMVHPLAPDGRRWTSQLTTGRVKSARWSPDGAVVGVVSSISTDRLLLWDMEANAELVDVEATGDHLDFSADGRYLLQAGLVVRIWDLSPAALHGAACALVARNPSALERRRYTLPDTPLCPAVPPDPACGDGSLPNP